MYEVMIASICERVYSGFVLNLIYNFFLLYPAAEDREVRVTKAPILEA
jgi:hypothetical protein